MLSDLYTAIAALSAIILFLFGLENFSKEIQRISGQRFRKFLGNFTKIPVVGLFLGALITSIIQSSSATSVITIGLVNAGIISFKNSLGIIFGANVGTTVTAQLVAFKLTNFAPAFIILGFFLSLIRSRYSVIGKSIFYFGFVFFSLNLISSTLGPLQSDERVIALLTESQNIFYTAIAGALFTAIVQSSSVTTGLAVILVQNGLLSLENAVPIIIGANVGTTITALMSMFNLDSAAKKTALSHLIFNVSGAILFLPFSKQLISYFQNSNAEIALANIHLVINLVTSLIFTVLVTPFSKLIDKLISSNHHLDFPIIKFPEMKEEVDFSEIDNFVKTNQAVLFSFIKENYNLVTLSIETNYKNIYQTVDKRIDYMDYLENEFMTFFSVLINRISEDESSKKIIQYMNQYEYLYQLHDTIKDFQQIKKHLDEMYIEIQSEGVLQIREVSSKTLSLIKVLEKEISDNIDVTNEMRSEMKSLQETLNQTNREMIKNMQDDKRQDMGSLIHFFTYSQRLKDKISNLHHLLEKELK